MSSALLNTQHFCERLFYWDVDFPNFFVQSILCTIRDLDNLYKMGLHLAFSANCGCCSHHHQNNNMPCLVSES